MQASTSISIFSLLLKADLIIKIISLSLVVLSVVVWAIFFEKMSSFKMAHSRADAFEKKFWSGIMLEEFFDKNRNKLKHPIGKIFAAAMNEWLTSDTNQSISAIELIKIGIRERMLRTTQVAFTEIETSYSKNMSLISTIATLAPFIGLFGTVLGIMNSFKAIAGASNASLNVVAPGIAEALVTTAIGILVAIIALSFHVYITNHLNKLLDRVEAFRVEINNILSRELDSFSVRNYKAYQSNEGAS
jgi:biopolymer transport protein TolQ